MRWQTPEVATPRVVSRNLATFYALGGLASLAAAAGAPGGGWGRPTIVVFALTALVWSVILVRWANRWPRWFFHLAVSGASVLIGVVAALSPDPTTAVIVSALIFFAAVDAHFFFSRPAALLHVTFSALVVTIGLMLQGGVHPGTAVALDVIDVAIAVVTARLVSRASSASQDPLTGLRNRRGFDELLDEFITGARRTGAPMSAALLDVDHFKQVNDSAGHQAGDALLCHLAEVWRRELPRTAVIARHGGDEFALLMPGTPGPDALHLVRRIAGLDPGTGLSAGVAELRPDEPAADLMRRADRALYDAKRAGRGRAELDGGVGAGLAADLRAALAQGTVDVHYQPLVDLDSGSTMGVEALARWTHHSRGQVGPDEFIPVAEQHGLVGMLGEHVLRTALTDLTRVHTETGRRLVLGVNVSGRELTDPHYPRRVRAVLAELDWPAEWLILEVTESVLDGDSTAAVDGLHSLRAAGLHAAVDDFGTGYSSLSRLDNLPVDHLKVDASFTAALTTSPRRVQLFSSLLTLAEGLDLRLVAEGVETSEQHEVLRAMGCPYAQGWLYGAAEPVDELIARVAGASNPSDGRISVRA